MYNDIATHENPVQEKSLIKAKVVEISTPITQK
jgi:hypothetical protein